MYGCYTMDAIAGCAYATKTNAHKDPNDPFVVNGRKVFRTSVWRMFSVLLLPRFLLKLLNIKSQFPEEPIQFFVDVTRKIIRLREQSGNKKYNDFVSLMMNAGKGRDRDVSHRDETDAHEAHHVNEGMYTCFILIIISISYRRNIRVVFLTVFNCEL